MKNIQIIDDALNCVYDIFSATDEEFNLIFLEGADIAFIEDLSMSEELAIALSNIWLRRVKKKDVKGIHGTLFYDLEDKKRFYPTLKDEEATNPNGTLLRRTE